MNKLLLAALLLPLLVRAEGLPNPGFEKDTEGWIISEKTRMSTVAPDAAHEGKFGLRVKDEDEMAGSSAATEPVAVEPGATVEASFFARTLSKGFAGVYLWFYDGAGKLIKEEQYKYGQGHAVEGVKNADGEWSQYTLTAVAPADAARVSICIHSFGKAKGSADFDDFELKGVSAGASAVSSTPAPALPARAQPPVIIIKADDLRPINGNVNGLWNRFTGYLKSKNIKASIGMLADKLDTASPDYVKWVQERQASGDIEFWFHGWDHATHDAGGKPANEFVARSFDEQKKRFDDSQALAQDKFGWPFATFGPPGGTSGASFDANTVKVMAEDPNMKVWLYPQPLDEAGRKLEQQGKVVILDRVWAVNFESKVGQPDFQKFVEGYARNPNREYFVLQGHPMHWGDSAKWGEFTKIIDFLQSQNAVFMTPSEYAALKSKKP